MVPIFQTLLKNKLRVLIYSGDTDFAVPYLDSQYWTSHAGLRVSKPWAQWHFTDGRGPQVRDSPNITLVLLSKPLDFELFRQLPRLVLGTSKLSQCIGSNRFSFRLLEWLLNIQKDLLLQQSVVQDTWFLNLPQSLRIRCFQIF